METGRRRRGQAYLSEGSRSGAGAEEAAEAAGSPVLPALWPSPNAGQGAADLAQSIRGGNIHLPQELCDVLPASRLTLKHRREENPEKNESMSDGKHWSGVEKVLKADEKCALFFVFLENMYNSESFTTARIIKHQHVKLNRPA